MQEPPGNWAPALVEPQWAEWKASHPKFCSMFRPLCDMVFPSNQLAVMTAQDMREHMLGIGSCWFVPLVILCTAFGVLRLGLPAASNSSFHLDKLTAWWHRGPRLSVISLKVYVCMLLLIELLGLSAPEPAVLSLPEALGRVRRHPYGPGELWPHSVMSRCGSSFDAAVDDDAGGAVCPGLHPCTQMSKPSMCGKALQKLQEACTVSEIRT